jgi:hypothetical protein
MEARELAAKFAARVAAAATEKDKRTKDAHEDRANDLTDAAECKRAMTEVVVPFLAEIKAAFPPGQFSFSPQIDLQDHQFVGVSFKVGNGQMVTISAAFGNIVIAQSGGSGSGKGIEFVYGRGAEPFISNSGDLTREKVAKLIETVIDNA